MDTKAAVVVFIFSIVLNHVSAALTSFKKDKNDVYLLHQNNIEEAIKRLDSLLVVFYSPKCQSCRQIESDLPKLVTLMASKDLEISIGKVDMANKETSQSLVDRYQLEKLPTLVFFVADGIVPYKKRSLEPSSIAQWLDKVCADPNNFINNKKRK